VERALAGFPPPVYVRRAIVHNAHVVARLRTAGATFVDELTEVPRGATVVLSAHGVPPAVWEQARARNLRVVDATCPLVAKVHREVRRYSQLGFEVIVVGKAGHDEVVATLGQAPGVQLVEGASEVARVRVDHTDRVACVTQTTLSPLDVAPIIDRIRDRFPALVEPRAADICYATRNRQAAVTWLARNVDVVLVIGDQASSNSQRLCEAATEAGTPAYLIASPVGLNTARIEDAEVGGVSAGASTPEAVVAEVVERLRVEGAELEEKVVLDERISFALPPEVAAVAAE
jgi:4-hydroxy-3-methylbut-2-enyl diphosphate reductase